MDKLLKGNRLKIWYVASAIGFIVDLCKGSEYGANYFMDLESDRNKALNKPGYAGFEGYMYISSQVEL